ncbi:membrane anchoring protein efr3a [Sorochytrium milnesiophthora]
MTVDDVKIYCFSNFVKHAHLVNNVYPARPGEEGARGSELAYLVYYASHRPEKLPKVGAYLEKKMRWDLQKNKRGYHKVTLEILNALLDACPTKLNYFAKNTMNILNELTDQADTELLAQATITFIKFNHHYDGSLASDSNFEPMYSQLIDKYCRFCTLPAAAGNAGEKAVILSGLEAVKSIVFSRFLFHSRCQQYLRRAIPAILSNIQKITASAQQKEASVLSDPPRRLTIFDDILTDDELANLAIACLQQLMRGLNVATISCVLEPIFAYMNEGNHWTPSDFPVVVFCCAARASALRSEKAPVPARTSVLRALTHILLDSVSPSMGVSIYEIVDVVLLQLESVHSAGENPSADIVALRSSCQQALDILLRQVQAMGQLRDTLAYIVTKVTPNTSGIKIHVCKSVQAMTSSDPLAQSASRRSSSTSQPTPQQQQLGLHGHSGGERRPSSDSQQPLSTVGVLSTGSTVDAFNLVCYDTVGPIVSWLADPSPPVRVATFELLSQLTSSDYMQRVPVKLSAEDMRTFCAAVHSAIMKLSDMIPSLVPVDVLAVYDLACSLLDIRGESELLDLVPLFFKLQSKLVGGEHVDSAAQASCCFVDAIVAFFQHVGITYNIQPLLDHASQVMRERSSRGLWVMHPSLQFAKGSMASWREMTSFDGVVDATKAVATESHPVLAKEAVVDAIASYAPLKEKYERCQDILSGDFPRLQRDASVPNMDAGKLYKPRSVLRFDDIMSPDTTGAVEEFRAILEGRHVLRRPLSMGPDWQAPTGEYDLDKMLDEIGGSTNAARPHHRDAAAQGSEQQHSLPNGATVPIDDDSDDDDDDDEEDMESTFRPPVGDFAL